MQTDFLQFIFGAINDLLTQNLGFFDNVGPWICQRPNGLPFRSLC